MKGGKTNSQNEEISAVIIAIDIEKYSCRPTTTQLLIVKTFTEYLNIFGEYDTLSTGDGVAVIVTGDKLSTYTTAIKLSKKLLKEIKEGNKRLFHQQGCTFEENGYCKKCAKFNVRIGIDQGSLIKYTDNKGRENYAGTPLNRAFRIMGLAHSNKIAINSKMFEEINNYDGHNLAGFQIASEEGFVKHGETISINRYKAGRVAPNWKRKLNSLFNQKLKAAKINGLLCEIPILKLANISQTKKAPSQIDSVQNAPHTDDPHAFAGKIESGTWHYIPVKYSDINKERNSKKEKAQKVIYSTVLVICRETKEILLHKRGSVTRYKDCFHVFGGGFMPEMDGYLHNDKDNLLKTAMREILEETGLTVQWDKNVKLLHVETTAGGEELLFLGMNVTKENVEYIQKFHKETWEGKVETIKFDKFPGFLLAKNKKWSEAGMVAILSWLALGAPGGEAETRFGKETPQELFSRVHKELLHRFENKCLEYKYEVGLFYKRP